MRILSARIALILSFTLIARMRMQKKSLSLTSAVLLCLNTMLGAGIFVNPKQLALLAGSYAPFGYIIATILMLPLIFSIAELARLQPVAGGLYVYSKLYVGKFAGFLSGWSYFLAKATSSAFLAHTVNTYFYNNIPLIQSTINPLIMDAILLFFIASLHIVGITIGTRIQYFFTAIKLTPLFFGFLAGFFAFNPSFLFVPPIDPITFGTLGSVLPVCLYGLVGFEVICAIGGFIENPAKNISRAIFTAFISISCAAILFQFLMHSALGPALSTMTEPMFSLGLQIVGKYTWIARVMNGLIFASITGGAFFMTGSNCWNLHTIAKNGHLPFGKYLAATSKSNTPWVALLVQASISITMLAITSQQLPLQNMAIFGSFATFFFSCLAAIQAGRKNLLRIPLWVPMLAVGTCSYVIGICLKNIVRYGISIPFLTFFILGCAAAIFQQLKSKADRSSQKA